MFQMCNLPHTLQLFHSNKACFFCTSLFQVCAEACACYHMPHMLKPGNGWRDRWTDRKSDIQRQVTHLTIYFCKVNEVFNFPNPNIMMLEFLCNYTFISLRKRVCFLCSFQDSWNEKDYIPLNKLVLSIGPSRFCSHYYES